MFRDHQVKYPLFFRYCHRCTEIIKWNIHYFWDTVTDVQRSSSEVSIILEILSQMYRDNQVKYPLFFRYCYRHTELIKWSIHYSWNIVTDVQRSSEISIILEILSQMYRDHQVKYPLFLRYCHRCSEIIKWSIQYSWDTVTDVQWSASEISIILEILSQMYRDHQVKFPLFFRHCHRCTEIVKWSIHYSWDTVTDVHRWSSEISIILDIF